MKKRIWTKPKGHWPKGKRRNEARGWTMLRERLKLALKDRLGVREAARRIGVHERTIRKWRDAISYPDDENLAAIRSLLRQLR